MDFYEEVLIKLKRRYGKDETVAALIKKLSEAEIENGKLKSEVEHLQYEVDNLQKELKIDRTLKEINKAAKVAARKEELYMIKNKDFKEQQVRIRQLKYQRDDAMSKFNSLEKKYQELLNKSNC